MNKFASFYLVAAQKKSLRDDISVSELPSVVRDIVVTNEQHKKAMLLLRQKDILKARDRLEKLQAQIATKSEK
jgi:hypothetical protein